MQTLQSDCFYLETFAAYFGGTNKFIFVAICKNYLTVLFSKLDQRDGIYIFALDWHFSNQQMVVVKADRSSESVSMSSLFNVGEVKRCDRQRLIFILLFT